MHPIPDADKLVIIAAYVPPPLAARLKAAAQREERSVSYVLRRALLRELAALEFEQGQP